MFFFSKNSIEDDELLLLEVVKRGEKEEVRDVIDKIKQQRKHVNKQDEVSVV